MNWRASHLADRKLLWGAVQNERLIGRKEQDKEVIPAKSGLAVARSLTFSGCQMSITSADQVISD